MARAEVCSHTKGKTKEKEKTIFKLKGCFQGKGLSAKLEGTISFSAFEAFTVFTIKTR